MNRKKSRVLFAFGSATAVAVTCLVLYSLTAGLSLLQASLFLVGSLIVVWAGLFSFFEVRRIASGRSTSICLDGSDDGIDPDTPCVVMVEPPTGEATPHHEDHLGSEGLDQGQLTSRIPDTFPIAVTPTRAREPNQADGRTDASFHKHYFQELGKGILESLDEDPEMEPGQADTTPGDADTEDQEPEKKPASAVGSYSRERPTRLKP